MHKKDMTHIHSLSIYGRQVQKNVPVNHRMNV